MTNARRGPGAAPGSPAPRPGASRAGAPATGAAAQPTVRGVLAPPPAPAWESRVARLGELIEQFRVDSERFFNGALPIPPEELRTKIQRELRELRTAGAQRGAVDQFRLGSHEARFNSLSELYGRRVREREEGRGAATHRPVVTEAPRHDARTGIVFDCGREGGPDREPDAVAVEALWSGLVASGGGARIELETFRGYLTKQLGDIRSKTGVSAVQFRVVQEEGKLKLKAKPIGPTEPR
jgi:hypothetical protein